MIEELADSIDTHIILVYCLCEDLLKWQHHRNDPQCALSDATIMTTAIVAALCSHGKQAIISLWLAGVNSPLRA